MAQASSPRSQVTVLDVLAAAIVVAVEIEKMLGEIVVVVSSDRNWCR